MCMISAVIDYGRRIPVEQWTPNLWAEFHELLERVRKIDDKLSQPDCEDPDKAAWMRDVEKRLAVLEAKMDDKMV